jgi:hypothetical protein
MAHPLPGSPTLDHVDLAALDAFHFTDGGGYPPSYRDFIRSRGWARTFGLWLIYPPVLPGFADGRSRAANLTARFQAAFRDGSEEGYEWMVKPDGDWDLAKRLEVFGWSENGDVLLWDLASRDAEGEFPVWESRGMNTLHRLGASLTEALPRLRESAGTDGVEPLTPSHL